MSRTDKPKSLYVRASKHASNIINHYVQDRDIQDLALECYMDKRPKTYAETYKGIYDLSRNTKWIFHFISGLIAWAFMQFLLSYFITAMGVPPPPPLLIWVNAAFVLALAEYGQHKTLNTLWKVYFQDGRKFVPSLVFLVALFSLFSIVSSGYSAYYFLDDSQFAKIGVALSLFVETMIVVNSYNIHNYRYKTALTVEMINDYTNAHPNSNNPLVPNFHHPNKLGHSETPLHSNKVNGHNKHLKEQTFNFRPNPVITMDKEVKSLKKNSRKTDKNAWTKTYLNGRISTYNRRIEKRGEKGGTDTQKMQKHFLLFLKDNWHDLQDGGVVPDVPNDLRKQFYQTQNSQPIRAYIAEQNSQTVGV